MKIDTVTQLPCDFKTLVLESEAEGYRFLRTLLTEWDTGLNRFSGERECLLLASADSQTVGICGINKDPYIFDDDIARLRHLYCMPAFRNQGTGSKLVLQALKFASTNFRLIRLRVADNKTDSFYQSLGFTAVNEPDASHVLELKD